MKVEEFLPGKGNKAHKIAKQIVDGAIGRVGKESSTYELEAVAYKDASRYNKEVQDAVSKEIKMRKTKHVGQDAVDTHA